jgi:hypothetical protein
MVRRATDKELRALEARPETLEAALVSAESILDGRFGELLEMVPDKGGNDKIFRGDC